MSVNFIQLKLSFGKKAPVILWTARRVPVITTQWASINFSWCRTFAHPLQNAKGGFACIELLTLVYGFQLMFATPPPVGISLQINCTLEPAATSTVVSSVWLGPVKLMTFPARSVPFPA
jgi:hypothetical protein